MSRRLKVVPTSRRRETIEKELLEEKAARQQEYSDKVNTLLREGNCSLVTVVQVGNVAVTLDNVIALPHQIAVLAN